MVIRMTEDRGFDYAAYVISLEAFRIAPWPLPDASVRLAAWRWPPLRPYNGFSGERRVRIWQLQVWAQDAGALARPTCCSVCDSGSHVGMHCESYADPWNPIPLCQACHLEVHRRFGAPLAWSRFKARHHRLGKSQWFDLLPARPIDLARWLKPDRGWDGEELLAHQRP